MSRRVKEVRRVSFVPSKGKVKKETIYSKGWW